MKDEPLPILIADADIAQARAIADWLKAWGRPVQVTQDGCQALGLLMHQSFAAVLLDIHLPILGGIDATKALRAGEAAGHRLPIVGLQTQQDGIAANRLIEAGMDAVLTKPFSPADLHATLLRLLPAPAPAAVVEATLDDPSGPCLDRQKIDEFIAGDAELFDEMIALVLDEYPRRMAQIAAAIRQSDGKALERSAHSLKGALSYFCRKFILQALQTLERHGRELNFAAAESIQTKLEALFPRLQTELKNSASHDTVGPIVAKLAISCPQPVPAIA